ncbi:hypothetical protein U14_04299 [Candidatus Moduliflexus flocculans]|uniref:Uncharacterized protein n=1 Tax=Candidatus Moduliflexus flocculans TaxID=1499966 RepID=A0A0S6W0D9_9BACT|nr:hypothetical protein U14_04299 [Candidatus Moduliflexus flocculans]
MNRIVFSALLVMGILLVGFCIGATESFSSDLSRFFTGTPTNKMIWMLIGGILVTVVGVAGLWPDVKDY